MDFYFRGCLSCSHYYQDVLKDVESRYAKDTTVCFLAVSVDANKSYWLNCIGSGQYSSKDSANRLNLYTNGLGSSHPMIRYYDIAGYPCPILVGRDGRVIEFDGGLRDKKALIRAIEQAKAKNGLIQFVD
jgi:hypothetical protein